MQYNMPLFAFAFINIYHLIVTNDVGGKASENNGKSRLPACFTPSTTVIAVSRK